MAGNGCALLEQGTSKQATSEAVAAHGEARSAGAHHECRTVKCTMLISDLEQRLAQHTGFNVRGNKASLTAQGKKSDPTEAR